MNKFDFKIFLSRVLPSTTIGAISGLLSSLLIAIPVVNLAVIGSMVGLCFGFIYDQYKYHISQIKLKDENQTNKYLNLLFRLVKVAVGGFLTAFAATYQSTNNVQASLTAGLIGAMIAAGTLLSLEQMN